MFFPMLRRQAKWVFVLLALVFAGGFVFFGVGSGQGGLGDVLQGWLGTGGSAGGPSISKLESKTRSNPKDAAAFHELANAYAADQQTDKAIAALQRYTALRPADATGLQELASQYERKLQDVSTRATNDPALYAGVDTSLFTPASTTPLGQAYASTSALGDPINTALQSLADAEAERVPAAALDRRAEAGADLREARPARPDRPGDPVPAGPGGAVPRGHRDGDRRLQAGEEARPCLVRDLRRPGAEGAAAGTCAEEVADPVRLRRESRARDRGELE